MAKTQHDRRVDEALRSLVAGREESLRDLAAQLGQVDKIDEKIAALHQERDTAIQAAQAAHERARNAGWKQRELADAGFTVPKARTTTPAPTAAPPKPSNPDEQNH